MLVTFPVSIYAPISLSPSYDRTVRARGARGSGSGRGRRRGRGERGKRENEVLARNMGHHDDPACLARDANNLGLAVP